MLCPICFTPGKETWYPLYRRLGGPNTEWFKAIILSLQSLKLIHLQRKLIIHNIFTMPNTTT